MGGCCKAATTEISSPTDEEVSETAISVHNICPEFDVSDVTVTTESRSSSPASVFHGEIQSLGFVCIKKLDVEEWPFEAQFAREAQMIWDLRHKRFSKFLGYCCSEKERFLVSESSPYETLATRLFNEKTETMEWGVRLRVAYCVAEALDFCSDALATYNNLSPYTIMFDKDGDACLSCFGLMKEIKDDQRATAGSVNSGSMIYRFGTVLVNLLTGKQIPPSDAPEMINRKNVIELMDPNLDGRFSDEEATVLFQLASRCFQYEDIESLNTKDLVETLKGMQTQAQIPSSEMTKQDEEGSSSTQQEQLGPLQSESQSPSSVQLSPLGEACLRKDLDAIHEILVMAGCNDDKEVAEYSFEECLPKMDGVKTPRQLGDEAFEEKDFDFAINCYTQIIQAREVVCQSLYARRCLSYLIRNKIEAAHRDMINAHKLYPDWPTGQYLMSVVLSKAGKTAESAHVFKQATLLEQKREES